MPILQEPIQLLVELEVSSYRDFPEERLMQVWGHVGGYEVSDPTGLQVLKKCRVSGRRHFCHPTSFQGRGCENGRSTEDPASGS